MRGFSKSSIIWNKNVPPTYSRPEKPKMVAFRTGIYRHHEPKNQTSNVKTGYYPCSACWRIFPYPLNRIVFLDGLFFCPPGAQATTLSPEIHPCQRSEVPTPHQFYRFMSRFDEASCILLTTWILTVPSAKNVIPGERPRCLLIQPQSAWTWT